MMEEQGYERSWSAALVSVAGVLAMLIPPSSPLIIYFGVTETPVGPIFLAGILPGILLGIILLDPRRISYVHYKSRRCFSYLETPGRIAI
jgi:TRAP-type C4-dicarboxylate transport system permease large subunit